MLIYCNGDSHSAGSELADDLYPGWPGFSVDNIINSEKKLFTASKNLIQHKFINAANINILEMKCLPDIYDNKIETHYQTVQSVLEIIEKYRAWPNQLHLIDSEIKVINEARGGAGMTGICQRTVVDLIRLKSENIKVDKVILQLTSTSRPEIYDIDIHEFMYERPIGSDRQFWKEEDDYIIAKSIEKKYTTHDYLIKYLYTLCSAVEAIKSLTGDYPLIVDSFNIEYIKSDIFSLDTHFKIKDIKQNLDRFSALLTGSRINNIFLPTMMEVSKEVEFAFCVMGHFSVDVHKKFAEVIYENINSRR